MDATLLSHAEDRAGVYRWLARWFLAPPDAVLVAGMDTPEMREVLGGLRDCLPDGSPCAQAHALAIAWTRLFSAPGPGQVPLYESVYRDPTASGKPELFGPSTLDVHRHYAGAGYQLDPSFGMVGDHLGVELAFMARLCERQAEALAAGETSAAATWVQRQERFARDHLTRWLPRVARRVEEQARGSLFARLLDLAAEFVQADTPAANTEG